MESIDRAVTDNAAEGFIKAAHRSNETVLGATVVESQAAGTSRDWSIAAARGLEMANVAQAHPSPATGNHKLLGTLTWGPDAWAYLARATVVEPLAFAHG